MSENAAIDVEALSKRYALNGVASRSYSTLRDSIAGWIRGRGSASSHDTVTDRRDEVWALRDVSFSVREGEALGIIGRNGAGKSTLLKILSRIVEPTAGRARVRGRMASLLEIGTGFHPELTGRENVFLNGTILGMTRQEIRRHFDAIVAFAEVERFLDTPVKHYSSGMHVRLGFAVAAHLTPEILVVDEVLAVGDHEFQRRCLGRMHDLAHSGRTVLFVSHNLRAVEQLCARTLLLRAGRVESLGPTASVLQQYLAEQARVSCDDLASHPDRDGTGSARITRVELLAADQDARLDTVSFGRPFRVRISYAAREYVPGAVVGFALLAVDGSRLWLTSTEDSGSRLARLEGEGWIECLVRTPTMLPGEYRLELWITDPLAANYADHLVSVGRIRVVVDGNRAGRVADLTRPDRGVVFVDCAWQGPTAHAEDRLR